MISEDIQKAFLQVRVRENERDALRFHWRCEEDSQLETLRFTRVLFGLASSPFLLAGMIEQHLSSWEERYPDIVAELRKSLYVDDLLSGGQTIAEAADRKERVVKVFEDATFKLHKWNSNSSELELNGEVTVGNDEETYAKQQQLGGDLTQTTMLGLKWNKSKDTLTVRFPAVDTNTTITKRTILSKLAKVYDPLGLLSPIILQGKMIFCDVCKTKAPWDADIREPLSKRWTDWEKSLPSEETVRRPIVNYREPVLNVELHTFGDASTKGVGAVVYSVVRQPSGPHSIWSLRNRDWPKKVFQGHDPVYLSSTHPFTQKLEQEAHLRTLHGGVGLTMTQIRKRYWIPKLRSLAKRQIKSCYGCRRFQAAAVVQPPPGLLPKDRAEENHAFQVVGVDYAGPLKYRKKSGKDGKAYIVLYTCSLTRALYLELTSTIWKRESSFQL